MRALRMVALDLREGLRSIAGWYVALIGVCTLSFCSALLTLLAYGRPAVFSLGEALVFLSAGVPEQLLGQSEPVRIPVEWLIIFMLSLYMVLWYPYRDFHGFGSQIMVASGGRLAWWFSKCFWVCASILLYWMVAGVCAFICAFITGGALDLRVTDSLGYALTWNGSPLSDYHLICLYLCSVVVNTVALALIQLVISLIWHPLIAYVASLSILVLSVLIFDIPYLLGNQIMFLRNLASDGFGHDPIMGIVIGCSVIAMCVVVGAIRMPFIDIVDRGN
ncbi:hypothetical protein K6V98_05950 [Collinsella sp. AGMB00827]|uniref:ABC transporter permease n=1 Tax=Collinsella ureilytica TaxID=2869515 RepID=A0ABS7MKJ9_9ACTN|nr:hypothetical protein [Collinsella urealyticum]MBY4797892.1 hypothetical protein [Collinsella urealyticum]